MSILVAGLIACLLYIAGASVQFAGMYKKIPPRRSMVIAVGLSAVLVHGYVTWQEIFTGAGINMGLLPMASLTTLAIAAMIIISSLRRPVENLVVVLFPLAAIIIILSMFVPDGYTPRAELSAGIVTHIILSVIAYSLLTMAAIQAALLSIGDYELKHHKLTALKRMPPLQTMEGLLFEFIWVGLIFLSLSIGTGFWFLKSSAMAAPGLVHHTAITFAAWVVFAILLWGRYKLGWRGVVASRWTLSGFALLLLGYFGSKFVLEMVLGRA